MAHGRAKQGTGAMAVALLMLSQAVCAATAQDDAGAVAREILDAGTYQTELPEAELPEAEPPPAVPDRPPQRSFALGPIADALLWLVVVGGAALLVYSIVTHPGIRRRLRRWRGDEDTHEARPAAGVVEDAPPASVAEADSLAREGRLDEAVHVLLLRAIEELRAQLDPSLPESLTSREVLRRLSLPAAARSALRLLVEAVERSLFGGRPTRPEDYEACRRSYRTLAGQDTG